MIFECLIGRNYLDISWNWTVRLLRTEIRCGRSRWLAGTSWSNIDSDGDTQLATRVTRYCQVIRITHIISHRRPLQIQQIFICEPSLPALHTTSRLSWAESLSGQRSNLRVMLLLLLMLYSAQYNPIEIINQILTLTNFQTSLRKRK